jgi:hypothetical protein
MISSATSACLPVRISRIHMTVDASTRLDDWYLVINRIYLDRNFYRDRFSIFAHLVEILGGLSLLASKKEKTGVTPETFVPKALAWWMALCGKHGVRSIEDMLWQKFPQVCPYCHRRPHEHDPCVEKKATGEVLDWGALRQLADRNHASRPRTLSDWQDMFAEIYPVTAVEDYPATVGRFTEELGELAEALRVWPIAPGYFLSEAADVFAWLMHLQNLIHSMRRLKSVERGRHLTDWFVASYPGRCIACGNPVCTCPPILPGTLGRIAHEIPTTTDAFAQGGAILTPSEASRLFDLGARTLRLGSREIETTGGLIREIHLAIKQLRLFAIENREVASAHSSQLTQALSEIEALASAHRLTQESIDALAQAIAAMPGEGRSTLMNFLAGLSSSIWATALVDQVKLFVGS